MVSEATKDEINNKAPIEIDFDPRMLKSTKKRKANLYTLFILLDINDLVKDLNIGITMSKIIGTLEKTYDQMRRWRKKYKSFSVKKGKTEKAIPARLNFDSEKNDRKNNYPMMFLVRLL